MEGMDKSSKIGFVVVFLFAVPFAFGGLFALVMAWKIATGVTPSNAPVWVPIILGLVFSGVGFGLMYAGFAGGKLNSSQMRLQAEHPAEPWLWRADWAQGRVQSKTRVNLIAGWVFAIFWNLVSAPVAIHSVPAAAKASNPAAYILLVFPAVGVYLLVRAIRQSIAFSEFGKTYFEMASVPGVIGRELKGAIQARFPHSPDHGVHLRLSSVHRVTTSSGDTSSTFETILWRDENDLAPEQLCAGPVGTTIPVAFRIPLGVHATEKINSRDEFVWLLEAMADVPGVNYHDIFELPVFRTAATPTNTEAAAEAPAEPTTMFATTARAPLRPEHLTVRVSQDAEGEEFYFPAARNKGTAMVTTVFTSVFGGFTYFLAGSKAPLFFPIVFGASSCLIAYLALQLWLGTSRVVIGRSLTVKKGILGFGRTREIALSDIASIEEKMGMQQGGATGTQYYDIVARLRDGGSETLGRTLPSKRETEWLIGEMKRLAGLQGKAAGAGAGA